MTFPLLKRWTNGLLLLGWAGLFLYFYYSGRLDLYLAPTFHPILIISAWIALLLGILYFLLGRSWVCPDPECTNCLANVEDTRFRSWFPLLATLLLVGGSLAVTRDSFSIQTVFKTGFIDSPAMLGFLPNRTRSPDQANHLAPIDHSVFGEPFEVMFYMPRNEEGRVIAEIIDLIFAVEDDAMRKDFDGEPVELIGQFVPLPPSDVGQAQYKLSRFVMWCCAADARPMAVRIHTDTLPMFPEMGWVKVEGRVRFPIVDGKRTVVVEEEAIEMTERPDNIWF